MGGGSGEFNCLVLDFGIGGITLIGVDQVLTFTNVRGA